MSFYDFLATNYKVESVIGLLSFIVSAILGFIAYNNSVKMKRIAEIVALANTKSKANLATALMEVMPSYEIPDLSQDQGFKIIKMQMEQKKLEFASKMNLLKIGIILFASVVMIITISTYLNFYKTEGDQSPIVKGDSVIINYNNKEIQDSLKLNKSADSVKTKTDSI
ncbi:hypothetical protein [Pedobacter gandavensis]|uniref:Uncharacterized protein n=1 Tax=Pedobacter gandavensis TaxID=2679963 RepID=A0ABR6ETX6_9SPHI|nr:hypothetical protein [Pedobacter gandavensis]MBB2148274.1 hypothetical protein [Pedobacter gandavensis]